MVTRELQPTLERAREPRTIFVHPPISSLVPNNPAGINSLMRVVNGEVGYRALNEEFLLGWMLTGDVLAEIDRANHHNPQYRHNLLGLHGVTTEADARRRIAEVIARADNTRAAFERLDTYTDFATFMDHKRILEDAAKIISAPFKVSKREREEVMIGHNTIDYYNSAYGDSRAGLLHLAGRAALYKDYLRESAVPRVLEGDPSLIAISVTHPDQAVFAFQLAHDVRMKNPDAVVIVGGNTISHRMESWSKNDDTNRSLLRRRRGDKEGVIDAIMPSEGELSYMQLTSRLVADPNLDLPQLFDGVYSVIHNREGEIVFNHLAPAVHPELFWRQDVSDELTQGLMPKGAKVFSIVDGRGCGWDWQTGGGCSFCSISKEYSERANEAIEDLGLDQRPVIPQPGETQLITVTSGPTKKIDRVHPQRRLGAKVLAAEIAKAVAVGAPVVDITDEQWTLHQGLELGDELARLGINTGDVPQVRYASYMRIDQAGDLVPYQDLYGSPLRDLLLDPEIAARLYRGGLAFAQFGLETTVRWKMDAMTKGTTREKVGRFETILRNFAQHDIMPHIFIMVGHPLKTDFWEDRSVIAAEDKVLGRSATASDLEIIEAFANIKFISDHKENIFTMKHTQYKLSAGCDEAREPEKYGLVITAANAETNERRDTTANLSFTYMPNHGPSNQVLRDILDLYEIWKIEELPHQHITEQYLYHQRIMPEMGASTIREMAASNPKEDLTNEQKRKKKAVLYRLWRQLVGQEYANHVAKLQLKDPDGQDRYYDDLRRTVMAERELEGNMFRKEFPDGFADWADLYRAAELLEDARRRTEQK